MRFANILIVLSAYLLLVAGCGRSESGPLTLQSGTVLRIEGCHVRMNHTVIREGDRFFAVNYVCDVPESARNDKNWWGDKAEPLGFTMSVGDCLLLDKTFYCVQSIEPDKASLKATYQWANRHQDHLTMLR